MFTFGLREYDFEQKAAELRELGAEAIKVMRLLRVQNVQIYLFIKRREEGKSIYSRLLRYDVEG